MDGVVDRNATQLGGGSFALLIHGVLRTRVPSSCWTVECWIQTKPLSDRAPPIDVGRTSLPLYEVSAVRKLVAWELQRSMLRVRVTPLVLPGAFWLQVRSGGKEECGHGKTRFNCRATREPGAR